MDSISFGVLTVSDRCFGNRSKDVSGVVLSENISEGLILPNAQVTHQSIVPDDKTLIQEKLVAWCDEGVNVILSTGGTGVAPRDVTPESVEPLLDVKVPGLASVILLEGLKKTPFAALSRTIVGIRKKTLIVTLPGSWKGALQGFEAVAPLLTHTLHLILDLKQEVAVAHNEISAKIKSKVTINCDEQSRLRQSKYPMIPMSAINGIYERKIISLPTSSVSSEDALGCILGEDIVNTENVPEHPSSMKDGYAVAYITKCYQVVGESKPAGQYEDTLVGTKAVKVSTGSAVPKGTKFVIPVEATSYQQHNATLMIDAKFEPTCSEIREVGSDMSKGDVIARKGILIAESEISLLATVGRSNVSVIRKPVIALLSTGDEIQDPWQALKPHGVRDSNKVGLKCLFKSLGYHTVDLGIARDEPDEVLAALTKGFTSADVVITTGGMSMGERDLIKDVLIQDLGADIHFGRLAMKPGKPTGFGSLLFRNEMKYWFGLPGNPASAFVTSQVVVLPALRLMAGWTSDIHLNKMKAVLAEDVTPDMERLEYQRGILTFIVDGKLVSSPLVMTTGQNAQRSSNIKGCSRANCFLEIPPGSCKLPKGSEITVVIIKL